MRLWKIHKGRRFRQGDQHRDAGSGYCVDDDYIEGETLEDVLATAKCFGIVAEHIEKTYRAVYTKYGVRIGGI